MLLKWKKKKERRKSCNPNLFFLPIFEHICKFISIFVFIFSMDILMASFFPLSLYQHLYSSREKNWLSCKVLCFLFFFLIKLICFQLIKSLVCFLCVCVQPQECCIAEELHTKHWLVQDWSNGAPTDWELHGRIREILLHLMV